MKEDSEKVPQSPEQIVDHLHVTSVPTYLLAMAVIVLLVAFIVWGVLGNVSDNPVIDDNGMIHIEATLEPHPHLLPGMTAFVTIEFR